MKIILSVSLMLYMCSTVLAQEQINIIRKQYESLNVSDYNSQLEASVEDMYFYQQRHFYPLLKEAIENYTPNYILHTSIDWGEYKKTGEIKLITDSSPLPFDVYYTKGDEIKVFVKTESGQLSWINTNYQTNGDFDKSLKKVFKTIRQMNPDNIMISYILSDVLLFTKNNELFVFPIINDNTTKEQSLIEYIKKYEQKIDDWYENFLRYFGPVELLGSSGKQPPYEFFCNDSPKGKNHEILQWYKKIDISKIESNIIDMLSEPLPNTSHKKFNIAHIELNWEEFFRTNTISFVFDKSTTPFDIYYFYDNNTSRYIKTNNGAVVRDEHKQKSGRAKYDDCLKVAFTIIDYIKPDCIFTSKMIEDTYIILINDKLYAISITDLSLLPISHELFKPLEEYLQQYRKPLELDYAFLKQYHSDYLL